MRVALMLPRFGIGTRIRPLRLLRAHLGGQDQRFPNLSGSWFEHNESSGWHLGSLLSPLQLIADDLRNNGAVE